VFHSELLFQFNDSCVVPTQGKLANHWGRLGAVLPNKARIPGTVSSITVADSKTLLDDPVKLGFVYRFEWSEPLK